MPQASDTTATTPHCNLCGLMCATSMRSLMKRESEPFDCFQLTKWQSQVPAHSNSGNDAPGVAQQNQLRSQLETLRLGKRTLLWLGGCDVQTVRSAVKLAERIAGTIHVAESPGSYALKSVIASEGWLGTTLSEISARAKLVVTLGDSIIREAPLLAKRFFHKSTQQTPPFWLHISQREFTEPTPNFGQTPDEVIYVPRDEWFDWMTFLALRLQADSSNVDPISTCCSAGESARLLAARLRSAEHVVWLWDIDELQVDTDELVIRRLLTIARKLAETQRCALLPLDSNVGRVTAEETLLWLTGCSTTATFVDGRWQSQRRYSGYSLAQWRESFDTIVTICNLPGLRSLPTLEADLVLQTQPSQHSHELQVAAVGITGSGHLFRGDRGAVHFVPAIHAECLPSAASVLSHLSKPVHEYRSEAASAIGT